MNKKGKAIASLVCGILGIVIPWFSIFSFGIASIVSLVLGIVAIILGASARKQSDEGKGMATAGLVLGIISIILGVVVTVCVCIACAAVGGSMAVLSSGDWSSLSSLADELSSAIQSAN